MITTLPLDVPAMPAVYTVPGDSAGPLTSAQQPRWSGHPALHRVKALLHEMPSLVTVAELNCMRKALAVVAEGDAVLIQLGDCAESFYECTDSHTSDKLAVLNIVAGRAASGLGLPAVQVGRIAGQFAKPRSQPFEQHVGLALPVFRGHLINSEVATPAARRHDPRRMLWAYEAGKRVTDRLASHRDAGRSKLADGFGPWSSHEMLVLDYEASLLRTESDSGLRILGSTHFPWIGERTRQPGGMHVGLLATVHNPVACKIGPRITTAEVTELCELLDPERIPGRLTLITRMGARTVSEALPPIAAAVRAAGHPVIWLCDPMHGNTVRTAFGLKTRHLTDMVREIQSVRAILEDSKLHSGGLHLEVAASPVTECVGGGVAENSSMLATYTTLCDPRLNLDQAIELIDAWTWRS
jgi:3-deoxy-7-phosphoheptulonate synthase